MNRPSALPLAEDLRARGLDWIVPEWPVHPSVRAFVTTRRGGVSTGSRASLDLGAADDNDAGVLENRRRLAAWLPGEPRWLHQVHGRRVVKLPDANAAWPEADAAVTRTPGVVCAVRTADCLPVFFADRLGRAVGVAHAGWRGLAAGVLQATIAAMGELGSPAEDLAAWLGPAIGREHFEVGNDVHEAFGASRMPASACFRPGRPGKWYADLCGLAHAALESAGVSVVLRSGACTYAEPERFFSFRRDRTTGRMAALIWLEA